MTANILVTGRCNLSCRHCSVNSHGSPGDDLSIGRWIPILDELQRNKVIELVITGGEPLLRSDLTEFLEQVRKRPFRFSINTNGTLISQETVNAVQRCHPRFNQFMVSLDGPDRDTVDSQRGTGVFDALVNGVEMLRAAGIPYGFYCTVTALNVHKLNETVMTALSLGGGWIKFNSFLFAGPGLAREMIPDQISVNRAAEKLSALEGIYPGMIQGTLVEMRNTLQKYRDGSLPRSKQRAYHCGGGRSKIAVFPDGRVTPCDHLPEFALGNLRDQSLEEILTGRRMQEFTDFLNRPRSDFPLCESCEHIAWCTGGCPVEPMNSAADMGYDRHSCLRNAMTK